MFTTSRAILKAFNNRKYIYFVTLKQDLNALKEQEKKAQEEKGKYEWIDEMKQSISSLDKNDFWELPFSVSFFFTFI